MPQEVEGRDVVVVDHVLAVVGIVLVQLLADPIKELLELSQGGIGGVDINPVFDHLDRICLEEGCERQFYLFTELTLDVLATLQLGYWDIIKSLQKRQLRSYAISDNKIPQSRHQPSHRHPPPKTGR